MTNSSFPPGPPPANNLIAMLRVMRSFERDMMGVLMNGFDQYGPVWMMETGGERHYVVAEPDFIYEVLVKQADQFHKNSDYTHPKKGLARFLGNGLLTSDGEFWRKQRKLVAPALHAKRIEGYADTMVDCTVRLVDGWRDGQEIDVDQAMMQTTLQIVARTLFNVDVSAKSRQIGDAMTVLNEMSGTSNSVESLLPDWVPTPQRAREDRAVRELDEIVYRLIAQRRQSGEDYGDLLSMLLLAQDDDGKGMSDKQARDEAVTIFLAGHETTANALNWTWVLLAQNPDVEHKLHAELDSVLAGRAPTLADLRQLPYTEQVIKEALRLYPPAHGFSRLAINDVQIGGYTVPKGANVHINAFRIHRDPRFWDEPLAFRPERFAPENEGNIRKFAYIPFGGGARICIGNQFALMEAQLMLATMAQHFRLRLAPGQQVGLLPLITLRPLGGLHMRLEAREPVSVPSAEAELVPAL